MPAKSAERRNQVATVAALKRHHPDSPELGELRAEVAAEGLADHIRRVVDSMPPLSDERIGRLVVLLRGGSDA